MKKVFKILLIIIISLFINVNASTNTYDRETLENYGVNKNWNIDKSNIDEVLNTYSVNASEKIYDFSDILNEKEERELKKLIDSFIKKYKTDVVILTDDIRYMSDYENENYASNFYDYNDFGMDYNNSGILLFRNTYSSDPYYNIYIFGDAQLYMSEDRTEATLNHIYDYIYGKNYYMGFSKFVNDLSLYYAEGIPKTMQDYEVNQNGYLSRKFIVPWFEVISTTVILTTIIMIVMINKNNMVRKERKAYQYIDKFKSRVTNRRDVFLSSSTRSYTMNGSLANGVNAGLGAAAKTISNRSTSGRTRIGSSGGVHRSGRGRHG